ncbi:MAG: hypothetical protein COV79_05250 [Parcubacteria group bacterium CG11_big_fil_rev_8_21_14_0_20_41_14]|nr:MAG: hypothetical protein COV79_05250 [Parcubacteria group bacterium CG11_big_fil_rev_8_21_14_0_20_41_14]PIR57250.1 MAG: hypothetical protein COU72_01915 [Parcubacteria group bacterium CG10_big_fil_rev_8_21_14_0_10_41_35]
MPTTIIALIIGIILGFAIAKLTNKKQTAIGKSTQIQITAKQENKDRIIAYLKENREAANNDIEKLLKVSDSSATRYLDELEKEGTIEQVGEKGRFVKYRLK